MKFDAVELDAPITKEHSADYWRERAECLEEWVCELLRKNQTLRMSRENDQPLRSDSGCSNLRLRRHLATKGHMHPDRFHA